MKYQEFNCEVLPKGLLVECGYSRFIIGCYEQGTLQYTVAVQWCRDQGGALPTLEQALVICEHRAQLDEALRAAHQREIGEHLWTRRRHPLSDGAVYTINTHNGNIDRSRKDYYNAARCIVAVIEHK